jgi:hypothetical protein
MDAATAQLELPANEPINRSDTVPVLPPARSAVPITEAAPDPAAAPRKPKASRDSRLDFWRGLCLVDMLLVHLIHQGMSIGKQADLWVGEYTRFAAGGFVFIAGLSVGRIFLPRARDAEKRWPTYTALWRRSLVILAVHYVAEIGFLLMWPLFGGVGFRHVGVAIWDVLTFRAGYDLLPLYVVMIALAPGMLELLRRKLWWVLAAGSVGLFVAAHGTPLWNPLWNQFKLPIQHDFFPILWQVIFVTGLLGAEVLPAYDRLTRGRKVALAAALWAAHAVLFVAYYGPNFGLHLWLPLTFHKVPLTAGEALRYLTLIAAIIVTTDVLWRRIDGGAAARFCERLGRNSLAVYVFHVWVVQAAVHASAVLPEKTARVALAAAGLGALWVFASLLEQGKPDKKKPAAPKAVPPRGPTPAIKPRGRLSLASLRWTSLSRLHAGGLPGLAVATVAALVFTNAVQRSLSPKVVGGRHAVASPAADLLVQSPPEALPDFVPDPRDDDVDPDEEEVPAETAGAEVGAPA